MARSDWTKVNGRWVRVGPRVKGGGRRLRMSSSAAVALVDPGLARGLKRQRREAAKRAYDEAFRCKHGASFCDACDDSDDPRWHFTARLRRAKEAEKRVLAGG